MTTNEPSDARAAAVRPISTTLAPRNRGSRHARRRGWIAGDGRRRSRGPLLAHAALVALAILTPLQTSCANHPDGSADNADDTGLASIDQALVADWVHPSCAPSALMPPAPNTCGGPWRFTYSEIWQNAAACGEDATQACVSNKTCKSWNANTIGDGQAATPLGPSTTSSASFTWRCTQPVPGGPTNCTGTQPRQITCTSKATAFKSQLIAGLAIDDLGHTIPDGRVNEISVAGALHFITQVPRDPETGVSSATWDCTYSISGVTQPSSDAWSMCGCAHYPAKTCERMSGSDVTAPGLPFPTTGGTPTFPEDGRVLTGATCLTCDQLPMVSDTDLQNKFTCFDGGLPGATGELRNSLIARMKLLYQLSGERLTGAQRARIDALYDESPGASTSCSVAIPWESGCQATATPLGVPGPLQLCQDLASNDLASRAVAASQTQRCIDQLAKTAQLAPETCRLPLRDLADAAAQGVMLRSFPELTGDLANILPEVLARIGAWWTAGTTAATGDRAWLLGHGNAVLRQLWISIERAKVPLPTGVLATDSAAAALLADITSTGFLDDFGVLSALFAPAQPPATPPVLTLAGDALQPVAERLARLEILHDVGCRFAACKTNATLRSSATSELVHALAVLPNTAQLTTVLASATRLAQQQPVLYAALSRMRDQHAYFDAAWTALGRSEPFAQLGAIVEPPSEVATLASVVRTATAAWSSYQDSGQFVSWHRPRLTSAALQQPALISFIDTLLGNLNQARAQFELARLETVNDVLAESRQQGIVQSAVDRTTALLDQAADLVDRELGLEEREAQERAGIATYQKAFEALVSSHVLDANAAFQTETLALMAASAASAKYPGLPVARDIAHDRFAVVAMHSGEALRLRVTNKWTPTCAIRSATLRGPDGQVEPIVTSVAETGPEGFWVSQANGNFTSHSTTDSTTTRSDIGVSVRACLALEGDIVPKTLSYKIETCAHADRDKIWDDATADSSGVDARTTASFASGVRLPQTPFPDAPAGSLLAVVTRAGHPNEIIDVRVVQRDDVIFAPALAPGNGNDVEIHFVANDVAGCDVDTTNALQIEAIKTIPFGNVAKAIGAAMGTTLTAIEAQAPSILAQGQITSEEMSSLRADAWVTVQQALLPTGIRLADLPYDVRQLFEGFLERELASISRRGVMHGLSREQRRLQLVLNSTAGELAFADAQNRLLLLVPRWRLRDLAGTELAHATDALTEALTAFVAPVYELRDPAAYSKFRGEFAAQINPLIDVNVTGQLEGAIVSLTGFATAARNALVAAKFDVPSQERLNLVVAVPRTSTLCGGVACDYGPFRSVSKTAATSFWSSLTSAPERTSVSISPADLYSLAGGASRLSCNEVAPIVRRVAMYLDTGSHGEDDLEAIGMHVTTFAGVPRSAVMFPLVGSTQAYDIDDPAGVVMSLPALNGDTTTVLSKFGPSHDELSTGAGISPFTSFQLNMLGFQSGDPQLALSHAGAVLLVFEVERRVVSGTALVPGVCP